MSERLLTSRRGKGCENAGSSPLERSVALGRLPPKLDVGSRASAGGAPSPAQSLCCVTLTRGWTIDNDLRLAEQAQQVVVQSACAHAEVLTESQKRRKDLQPHALSRCTDTMRSSRHGQCQEGGHV